ncbi:MAG: GNAT family N-acetyltransferase [Promethearchaeati archaeon SRVP18_Atabeyarchaeia-1]
MEILTYRDLESKAEMLPLMDSAFDWAVHPKGFKKMIDSDSRLKNGPVGFCAVENNLLVAFVGVMDLNTRTLDGGVEHVGGLWGVATLPTHAGKGISMNLMTRAHQYFREKGYRFSFLCTSRYLVAYAMYRKLGYTDLIDWLGAYKVLEPTKTGTSPKRRAAGFDFSKLLRIHANCFAGRSGFVLRDRGFLKYEKWSLEIADKECIIDGNSYVIFKNTGTKYRGVMIRELVARDAEATGNLLDLMEARAEGYVYDKFVIDETLLNVYKLRGYTIQDRSYKVVMAKPLADDASSRQTYGPKFSMTSLDLF